MPTEEANSEIVKKTRYTTPKQTIKLVPSIIFINFIIIVIGLWISDAKIDLWYFLNTYFMCVGGIMTAIAIWYFVKDKK